MKMLKNKTIGWTGIVSAALFFISAAMLAKLDMSFIDNLSLRVPDEHVGRVVPFAVKGSTLYLTHVEAVLAKGLTAMTFITLSVLALTFWLSEQAAKEDRN
jgi:hypothetical protein